MTQRKGPGNNNADEERVQETDGQPSERDIANDDPRQQSDHSEREWGGDQDIDTAGQVPGEMVTEED
jgi:hypothetical protein